MEMHTDDDCDGGESSSYLSVLHELQNTNKRKNRDAQSTRVAAVTSAMMEVVQLQQQEETTTSSSVVSATKMYACTVTALEGTLQTTTQHLSDEDVLSTQMALFELMRVTIPYVSSTALCMSLSMTSRVLRAVVTSCQEESASPQGETNNKTKSNSSAAAAAGINATLRATCRASTELLKHVVISSSETKKRLVKQLFGGTLLFLFHDARPKVRKAAYNGTCELLRMTSSPQNNETIKTIVSQYIHGELSSNKHDNHDDDARLLHILGFLERAILYLHVEQTSADVMQLLLTCLQQQSQHDASSDFVATVSATKDTTSNVLKINALLSVLLTMVVDETESSSTQQEVLDKISARVLASLLQERPTLVFHHSGTLELLETGRTLYGRVLLVSCQRLLLSSSRENQQLGYKLLPLVIQMVLQLSRPIHHNKEEYSSTTLQTTTSMTAQVLMVELTQLFRTMLANNSNDKSMEDQVEQAEALQNCLHECLRSMEQVLQHGFRPTWSVTLPPLAILLQLLSEDEKVVSVVQSLVELRTLVVEDGPARQDVEEALGSVIQGVGLEVFWNWIEWNPDIKEEEDSIKPSMKKKNKPASSGGIAPDRAWLLPLLKTSSSAALPHGPHLAFFQQRVLGLARQCDALGASATKQASFHKARVIDLWCLFPCFCQKPVDMQEALPNLAQTLVRAMGDARYPQLVTIICGGLKTLAMGVSSRLEDDTASDDDAQGDAQVFEQVSVKLLPALFKLVETLHGTSTSTKPAKRDGDDMEVEGKKEEKKNSSQDSQRVQAVTDAIAELARLAPRPFLQSMFKKIMQRLLAASQSESDETEKICTLLGLAQALVSSEALDEESIALLYRSMKPLIRTDEFEARVQKRAYKVMAEICNRYSNFATAPERLEELSELLTGSIITCQVSARHMRLKCMAFVVDGFDSSNKQHMDIITKVVGEVLLCLKDSNGKTREAAYQLLLSMAVARDDMTEYFRVILAALGAQTPHMRSAAVLALSRLVFEYAREDVTVQALLPSLLQTVLVLFDENAREVIKSVVGFVRVNVAAMTPEQLEPLLSELVGGMLKYHRGKGRFRAKIKIILKKLVRTYGYDTLMPLVPEDDTRLLTHMRKLDERAKRRKAAQQADGHTKHHNFDDMMESDEEDSDDGRTLMTGVTGFTRMTGRTGKSARSEKRSIAASTLASSRTQKTDAAHAPRLQVETNGEVLDMLDPRMAKNVHFDDGVSDDDSDLDDDDGAAMEFDDMGRLLVPDDLDDDTGGGEANTMEDDGEIKVGGKRRRLSKFESAKIAREEASQRKKGGNKNNQTKALGAAYKSKKAGGDVKKKDQKFEPYAYVPLDGKSYTKKNRRKAVEQMSTVVRGGKRKRS